MALRVEVESAEQAEAVADALDAMLYDMSWFFEQLEKARVLDISEREIWDRRFGLDLFHSPATVRMRAKRQGYYENQKGRRATSSSPYFEWTGKLREAASTFTTISSQRATVDPDFNYDGPIEAARPFSDIVSDVVEDGRVWDARVIGPRFERELGTFIARAIGVFK